MSTLKGFYALLILASLTVMAKATMISAKLGQTLNHEGISFTVEELLEDSRCPVGEGVDCAHPGRLMVRLALGKGELAQSFLITPMMGRDIIKGKGAAIVESGEREILYQVVEFAGHNIYLLRVIPDRTKEKREIAKDEYLFYLQFRPIDEEEEKELFVPRLVEEQSVEPRALEVFKEALKMRKANLEEYDLLFFELEKSYNFFTRHKKRLPGAKGSHQYPEYEATISKGDFKIKSFHLAR